MQHRCRLLSYVLDFVGDADARQLQGGSEARGGTHRGPCWSRAQALRSLGLELGRWMIMGGGQGDGDEATGVNEIP